MMRPTTFSGMQSKYARRLLNRKFETLIRTGQSEGRGKTFAAVFSACSDTERWDQMYKRGQLINIMRLDNDLNVLRKMARPDM